MCPFTEERGFAQTDHVLWSNDLFRLYHSKVRLVSLLCFPYK